MPTRAYSDLYIVDAQENLGKAVPMEKIVRSYYPLHEADIRKFVEVMDVWMAEKNIHVPETQ